MALLNIIYKSVFLGRNVAITALLPVDYIDYEHDINQSDTGPYKTLYLLNGLHGDCNEWITHSDIKRLAERYHLAVIMPSGENSFYYDMGDYNFYSKYIGEELVNMTRRMFNLSKDRKDTFIGGLSMGGFGALYNGFKYSETFSKILALSPAVIPEDVFKNEDNSLLKYNKSYIENIFGLTDSAYKKEINPEVLVNNMLNQDNLNQEIYLTCANDDDLISGCRILKNLIENNDKIDLEYFEWEGGHTWEYWNSHMENVMNWLKSD